VIPGKRSRGATLRGFGGAGLAEFTPAGALLQQPEERFPCLGILPDHESGMAFYRNQATVKLRAKTLTKCE
jgi:hypothetical protein